MREIKFRAWQGDAPQESRTMVYFSLYGAELALNPFWDTAIMQYTGLKDSKGVEIYEGDIVRVSHCAYSSPIVVISIRNLVYGDEMLEENEIKESVIIGNIYENPELLEGKK